MKNDQDTMIRRLDELLDVERQALLVADIQKLTEIVEEKESLIDALNEYERANPDTINPVQDKMQRNQALLSEAMDGIRSVARKLAELRQLRKAFDTYDHRGHRNTIEPDPGTSVEKRA